MRPVDVSDALGELAPISLAELIDGAELQTRIDRKYVVGPDQLDRLIERIGECGRVLDIDGRRQFGYESVYFDTPQLDSYLGAARRRPQRFKIRTRTYLDTGGCVAEVKLRGHGEATVKHRCEHELGRGRELTASAAAFVDRFETLAPLRTSLAPTLMTRYRRTTLLVGCTRTTLDFDVECIDASTPARQANSAGLDGFAVIETKNPGLMPGDVDRVLWEQHVRPVAISKYGVGMAALHADLPSNTWHRTIDRYVTVRP